MKTKIRFIALLTGILFLTGSLLNAQTTIKGKVVSKNNEPLVGAVVSLGETATETNDKGEFAIKSATAANNTIKVSLLGYATQEVTVDDASAKQTIQLAKSAEELDDAVVIGYGKSSKKKATGTVSTISRETLEQYPGTNVLEVLQGRVSGLTVAKTSGLPGSSASINIRGVTTIDEGFVDACGSGGCCGTTEGTKVEPLIVIDGVPFINESISPLDIGAVGSIGPLASLSTDDVERIDVLKDSDATAIYGARGANGVILITTKHSVEN
jgi:TonB-dependent SusC/RagA subfamily outer membrane receptor